MKYTLLSKQKEFMEIPHNNPLDIAIYQGGYGSGKSWCGALLGILLAKKYPGCKSLVGAKEYELVRKTTLQTYFEHLEKLGYSSGKHYKYNKVEMFYMFKTCMGANVNSLFSAFCSFVPFSVFFVYAAK